MTGERALGFVDTNVLVYAFDKSSSPKKRVAQRLMNELMEEDRLRASRTPQPTPRPLAIIESNPVRAGLAQEACQYRWPSASWATGGRLRTRRPPHQLPTIRK